MLWNGDYLTIILKGSEYRISIEYIVIILISLSIIFFITGFRFLFYRKGKYRRCNWKSAPEQNRRPFERWQCKVCGANAYTTDNLPPKECKKGLSPIS